MTRDEFLPIESELEWDAYHQWRGNGDVAERVAMGRRVLRSYQQPGAKWKEIWLR